MPGAFKRTIAERGRGIRILFDHGQDPSIGNKVLGVRRRSSARPPDGPVAAVPMFDTSYNRDLVPGLRAGAYGASFRFRVRKGGESWVSRPSKSAHNPEGLPERTLLDVDVPEFGPVTFPASPSATAGLRSDPWVWITPAVAPLTPRQRRAELLRRGVL